MAVLGAMHAIAALKLPVHVVGLIVAAENMIDAGAYRVDDILTMVNGVTVEVTNTDAEGRLVLADALAYGCKRYKPAAIVDLATLTGGVVVALGEYCAGMFATDDKLADRLTEAGNATGERLWALPLWPEHRKQMKSTHADIANSAGRGAHPIQGAAFLSYFVDENIPWAHLDIAGVADVSADKDFAGLYPKGPTAFGVRLLTRALETWR
jgi:leucyl aminopeptidase